MNFDFPRKIALVLVFLVPVGFIIGALTVVSSKIPNTKPSFDFVYTHFEYSLKNDVVIKDSKIVKTPDTSDNCQVEYMATSSSQSFFQESNAPIDNYPNANSPTYYSSPTINNNCKEAPSLYYHDVKNNSSRNITFEEAQKYTFLDSNLSPDGFTFNSNYLSNSYLQQILSPTQGQQAVLIKNGYIVPQATNGDNYTIRFKGWVTK